jgi:hypothetical protein
MSKYNTMVDVAFSVNHDFDDDQMLVNTPEGIKLIIQAMRQRLFYLIDNKNEASEAFGICDTYENINDD